MEQSLIRSQECFLFKDIFSELVRQTTALCFLLLIVAKVLINTDMLRHAHVYPVQNVSANYRNWNLDALPQLNRWRYSPPQFKAECCINTAK